MARTVFLSHAGTDTVAAESLRKRLEREGFDVWFDKRDLRAGHEAWQKQIEERIEKVDGFVVYVGSRGIVNWVEAETRYALSRAISGKRKLAFVPVLSSELKEGSKALPGFARQFQAVRNVENDPDAWIRLVEGLRDGALPRPEEEPFFFLKAIDAARNHLFFGRRKETEEIVQRIRDRNLVLVGGASGSGKSSLVRAGLIPAWLGNAVGVLRGEHPEQCDWLTVTMTPGDDPWKNLSGAIRNAAEVERGLSATEAAEYFDLAEKDNLAHKQRALRLNADPGKARVLLVVDQFEELFVRQSISPETRKTFADFLAGLADPRDSAFAVALTMRGDYTNHLRSEEVQALQVLLEAQENRARFNLRSILMSDPNNPAAGHERLRQVVTGPLALAQWPEAQAEALADLVLRDAGGDPGDLALVQAALSEAWAERDNHGKDLLKAYVMVGRVEGALAKSADDALRELAAQDLVPQSDVEAALIRLGSVMGVSPLRRTALRSEFTEPRWKALQFFASEKGKRLVQITGEGEAATAEIAHEALLTQWERLSGLLTRNAEVLRLLHSLAEWRKNYIEVEKVHKAPLSPVKNRKRRNLWQILHLMPNDPESPTLSKLELKRFQVLNDAYQHWITPVESEFIERSVAFWVDQERSEAWTTKALSGLSSFLIVVGFVLWWAVQSLQSQIGVSLRNERSAYAALTDLAITKDDPHEASLLLDSFLGVDGEISSEDLEWLDKRLPQVISANLGGWTRTPALEMALVNSWLLDSQISFIPGSARFSAKPELVVASENGSMSKIFDLGDFEFSSDITAALERRSDWSLAGSGLAISQTADGFEFLAPDGSMIRSVSGFDLFEPNVDPESDLSPPYPFQGTPQSFSISQDSKYFALLFDAGRLAVFSADSLDAPILRMVPEDFGNGTVLSFEARTVDFLPGSDAVILREGELLAVVNFETEESFVFNLFKARLDGERILLGFLPIRADLILLSTTSTEWSGDFRYTSVSLFSIDITALLGSERLQHFCRYVLNPDVQRVRSRVEASYALELRSFCSEDARSIRLRSLIDGI